MAKTIVVGVRATTAEVDVWRAHARARGKTVTQWLADLGRRSVAGELGPVCDVSAPQPVRELSYSREDSQEEDGGI